MMNTTVKKPLEIGNETEGGEDEGADGIGEMTSVVSHRTEGAPRAMQPEKISEIKAGREGGKRRKERRRKKKRRERRRMREEKKLWKREEKLEGWTHT